MIAAALLVPGDLAQTRGDALASIFYVNNWHQVLADQSYFAAFERPSLLRHLWSLAIEEQFYLIWPLLLGVRADPARPRAGPRSRRSPRRSCSRRC